ncbi:MAG: hypothetical protein ACYC5X_10215 [Syntrophales bacterium]
MRKNRSADRWPRRGARILLLITAFGPLLAGCAGGKAAAVPAGGTYALPEAALHALAASAPIGTVTATARIEINNHGERYPLKAAMMIRRPADLRLESIPLLGLPDFFLSIYGGELRVFLPGKGAFYAGPATSATISRFFPLALPAAEIVSLLMGRPPGEGEASSSLGGEPEDGLYRVDQYRHGRKVRSLWIDPAGGVLIRARAFTEGEEIVYTAEFADYTQAGKGFMPQRVTISGEAMSLTLRYTEIRMLDDAASFALPIPSGVTPIPLQEE